MYQDIDNLDALLHYETWAESKESFYENQWDKPYRQEYEKPRLRNSLPNHARLSGWISKQNITATASE